MENSAWASFLAWLDSFEHTQEREQIGRLETQVRGTIATHNVRNAVAFRPLPYGHELGPTPTPKGGFGLVGGGNRSGSGKRKKRAGPQDAPVDYSELKGFHTLDGKPLYINFRPDDDRQERVFDNNERNFRRIRVKGKKTPIGRPRTGGDKERLAKQLLAGGMGVKSVARKLGTGVSFVQRVKKGTEIRPT